MISIVYYKTENDNKKTEQPLSATPFFMFPKGLTS